MYTPSNLHLQHTYTGNRERRYHFRKAMVPALLATRKQRS